MIILERTTMFRQKIEFQNYTITIVTNYVITIVTHYEFISHFCWNSVMTNSVTLCYYKQRAMCLKTGQNSSVDLLYTLLCLEKYKRLNPAIALLFSNSDCKFSYDILCFNRCAFSETLHKRKNFLKFHHTLYIFEVRTFQKLICNQYAGILV